jgi:hypothetical protein
VITTVAITTAVVVADVTTTAVLIVTTMAVGIVTTMAVNTTGSSHKGEAVAAAKEVKAAKKLTQGAILKSPKILRLLKPNLRPILILLAATTRLCLKRLRSLLTKGTTRVRPSLTAFPAKPARRKPRQDNPQGRLQAKAAQREPAHLKKTESTHKNWMWKLLVLILCNRTTEVVTGVVAVVSAVAINRLSDQTKKKIPNKIHTKDFNFFFTYLPHTH